MATVAVPLTMVAVEHHADVTVSVNGSGPRMVYRVEVFRWNDWCGPSGSRADALKRILRDYEPRWQLVEIGTPSDLAIPLMFRKRTTERS